LVFLFLTEMQTWKMMNIVLRGRKEASIVEKDVEHGDGWEAERRGRDLKDDADDGRATRTRGREMESRASTKTP
jgi:hypothetical protein